MGYFHGLLGNDLLVSTFKGRSVLPQIVLPQTMHEVSEHICPFNCPDVKLEFVFLLWRHDCQALVDLCSLENPSVVDKVAKYVLHALHFDQNFICHINLLSLFLTSKVRQSRDYTHQFKWNSYRCKLMQIKKSLVGQKSQSGC